MPRSHSSLGRLGAAVLTTSVVACLAMVAPASAATSGVVTVTGGSVSTIELNILDNGAQFGTNLAPDGLALGNGEATAVNQGAAGACYEWPGSITVKSNVSYGVTVVAAAANTRLDFLASNPATYLACTTGEQVGTAMYPGATPVGAWVNGQSATASSSHLFWLGLDVQWADAPNANLANASLTLTAGAGW